MKLLVFAHVPPPHHGQSYMVQLMLAGFGGDCRKRSRGEIPRDGFGIECYHVNARLSRKLEDIGNLQIGKFFLLLWYCLQAIWCRLRYGVRTLYYIPAPGKNSALYRDWFVMFLCRIFFPRVILHWHAAGLAQWLENSVQLRTRAITYRFLKKVDLSIVLSQYNRADADKLYSQEIKVVSNGIADPCPDFDTGTLPRRTSRYNARRKLMAGQVLAPEDFEFTGGDPQNVKVLYIAHCTTEKGLFDTLYGVILANQRLAESLYGLKFQLQIAGTFVNPDEKAGFEQAISQPEVASFVRYFGFVTGEQKNQLFRESDIFCFPTYYENENQPVNLIEAMAFGLPILTTRWRSIPELFPANYTGLVDIRSPEQIATVMLALLVAEKGEGFRENFLRNFTLNRHLSGLAEAFLALERRGSLKVPTIATPALR